MTDNNRIIDVCAGPDGSSYIVLPDDIIAHLDCEEGDTVEWLDNGDGSFTLRKFSAKNEPF